MQDDIVEQDSCFGRMSPEPSPPTKEKTLREWSEKWLGPISTSQKVSGKKPEWLSAQTGSSSGELLTLNMSEFNHIPEQSPSDVDVCSLSLILETGPIDPRYFLSPKACQGILRRAEARGRALPPSLQQALVRVAQTTTTPKPAT